MSKSWNGYAAIVYPGLIGESARWGDLHVSRPEVREGNWQLATGNASSIAKTKRGFRGERKSLRDRFGELLVTLTFRKNDRWPATSDTGQTLEFRGGAGSHPESAVLWQLSASPGGTPGESGAEPTGLAGWLASRGIADAAQTVPVSGLPALLYYALGEDNLKKALAGRLPELTAIDENTPTLRYSRRALATVGDRWRPLPTWSTHSSNPVTCKPGP